MGRSGQVTPHEYRHAQGAQRHVRQESHGCNCGEAPQFTAKAAPSVKSRCHCAHVPVAPESEARQQELTRMWMAMRHPQPLAADARPCLTEGLLRESRLRRDVLTIVVWATCANGTTAFKLLHRSRASFTRIGTTGGSIQPTNSTQNCSSTKPSRSDYMGRLSEISRVNLHAVDRLTTD